MCVRKQMQMQIINSFIKIAYRQIHDKKKTSNSQVMCKQYKQGKAKIKNRKTTMRFKPESLCTMNFLVMTGEKYI